jgi:hypothetical protein
MAALLLPGGAKRGHIWGRSGKADAKMIHGELQILSFLPDSAAYLNVLIAFAERLREGHADQSADGRYWDGEYRGQSQLKPAAEDWKTAARVARAYEFRRHGGCGRRSARSGAGNAQLRHGFLQLLDDVRRRDLGRRH